MSDALQSLRIDQSAGPLAILREAVRLLPEMPVALALFVATGLFMLVSPTLGNLFVIVPQAVGLSAVYEELGGRRRGTNSFGVRVLLAFLAALIAGAVILLGLLLLVLPGIYLIVRLRLVVSAAVLEDSGPLGAFGRSFRLTAGREPTVFGVWLLPTVVSLGIGAVTAVATGAVTLAGGPGVDAAALQEAGRVAGAANAALLAPVGTAADAVMYGLYGPDRLE